MTLQEIFDIISANIAANAGSLKLAPDTISSPEITELFDKYLLNTDLVIDDAIPLLNTNSVSPVYVLICIAVAPAAMFRLS